MPPFDVQAVGGLAHAGAVSGTPWMTAAQNGTSVAPSGYASEVSVAGGGKLGSASAFSDKLVSAVSNLQELQDKSADLALRAVTGDLDDIHDYTVAATEAKVTLELTAAVRNKAVDAFTEIMRMQS
ncbi:flagellar hook-basal body complex protein FliE [Timonella senegalensis]|jgi:flagellar hook-basal body complex protein FliE|uniref:flagellar hook-basal body complex protein FliE n=1 Tax=Timonella senegalensis TaxID=1465825 RepID=UPI00030C3C17|nr:flagellar hook-basal body complex protein FliE [Timonella senegalensis]